MQIYFIFIIYYIFLYMNMYNCFHNIYFLFLLPLGLFSSVSSDDSFLQPPSSTSSSASPIQYGSDGLEGIITKALLVGNFESAVRACIAADRMADAFVL